jgi:hypothetical protein
MLRTLMAVWWMRNCIGFPCLSLPGVVVIVQR